MTLVFFWHIDSKSPEYKEIPKLKYAKIYNVPRMHTVWGYSLVKGELLLLEYAHNTDKFDYYHLLSGQDMILRPMREINQFFEENSGKEFVHFDKQEKSEMRYERIKYYMIFQDFIGKKRKTFFSISQKRLIIPIQKLLGVDRTKNSEWIFKSGS